MIAHGQIGASLNVRDPHEISEYQHMAVEKSRLDVPLIFGLDMIHGFKTEFPIPGLWLRRGIRRSSRKHPGSRPSRLLLQESGGHSVPWRTSRGILAGAGWRKGRGKIPSSVPKWRRPMGGGYRCTRLDAPDGIAACAKHFVGYGAAEGGRDYYSTEISEHRLRQFNLPAFHDALEAGTATLMSVFNSLNGVPASANAFTLTRVLERERGFKGTMQAIGPPWEILSCMAVRPMTRRQRARPCGGG
jgi:beta-glucosidase